MTPSPPPYPPPQAARTPLAGARQASAAEVASRGQYVALCLGLHTLTLFACAQIDALRVPDLVVTIAVLVVCYQMAIRDSRHLAPFLISVWVLGRFVRRLIDWQEGGFESLTALSLLPMMAMLTTVICTAPRWRQAPHQLRQCLLLMGAPIAVATAIGLAAYGKAAVIDASGWLLPLLFVPYYAVRPTSLAERKSVLRFVVTLAAVVAAYGWYQFLYLPPWDAMWLRESGMTSSMGEAKVNSVRVWGTLSSTGPAAAFWASSIGLMIAGVRPKPVCGALHGLLIGSALLLSRVRICWVSTLVGLVSFVFLKGSRGSSEAIGFAVVAVIGVAVSTLLPGGDLVSDRLDSFTSLSDDHSFRTRKNFAFELVDLVTETPFGRGIGYGSAAKVSGASSSLAAFDNGFGAVLYSLGLPGGLLWFTGVAMLGKLLYDAAKNDLTGVKPYAITGSVQLAISVASLASAFFMGGDMSVVLWLTIGLAFAPLPIGAAAPATHPPYLRTNQ
ncbi:hypothetical protein Pla108_21200 [Botrimarina colliarenosi]|uniref:O-Antigen ligase n=1 Tax=Botrimarina colliarenosi TaxID=2528001 RepID=A0A5C6AFK0_9BACT|nr:hypothetical protein [Botrimarina colliarenosi]TWT97965.1 hypothetical protein Pla108_21200 [Botrimarina colliarenosi]